MERECYWPSKVLELNQHWDFALSLNTSLAGTSGVLWISRLRWFRIRLIASANVARRI